jgi:hypothetical protein
MKTRLLAIFLYPLQNGTTNTKMSDLIFGLLFVVAVLACYGAIASQSEAADWEQLQREREEDLLLEETENRVMFHQLEEERNREMQEELSFQEASCVFSGSDNLDSNKSTEDQMRDFDRFLDALLIF